MTPLRLRYGEVRTIGAFREKVVSGQVIPDCLDCLAGKSVPNDLRDFGGLLKV